MFKLESSYQPAGDQPAAIECLTKGLQAKARHQTLLGVTGSGKTFTMAHVIANCQKPTLILAHNKTLAAQLYSEFKTFFPTNAVEYFVSYYDYYQPEAYIPRTDVYIEKDSSINESIDQLRHAATHSLLTRQDVIIVASVSCIYGLGSPEAYQGMLIDLGKGMCVTRKDVISKLIEIQYLRNDQDFHRGTFRVRGDVLDVFPAYHEDRAIRIQFFDDEVEQITEFDVLTMNTTAKLDRVAVYPNTHFVTPKETRDQAVRAIRAELADRLEYYDRQGRLLERQRIDQRTRYDLEMIEEIGFCKGIENYSRHFEGRQPGLPPPTLLQYFPKDFLLFVDESHITIPQVRGMHHGDRARKETLVEYGFRLPSALDNRPLTFDEFEQSLNQVIYVSATPAEYELTHSVQPVARQIIRPTGLVDPEITIKAVAGQVEDLLAESKVVIARGERVLVTTLTKRMAENLSRYLVEAGVKAKYLHSDIDAIERFEILRDLRRGDFDVLVGINLLREGLDLPEVSLVAILDGDQEGFLRSERSLIQTFGRAARNLHGRVIVYADRSTDSLARAVGETNRRRTIQLAYNQEHGIVPQTILKAIPAALYETLGLDPASKTVSTPDLPAHIRIADIPKLMDQMRKDMHVAAKQLDFERAAQLRDEIKKLREMELTMGGEVEAQSEEGKRID